MLPAGEIDSTGVDSVAPKTPDGGDGGGDSGRGGGGESVAVGGANHDRFAIGLESLIDPAASFIAVEISVESAALSILDSAPDVAPDVAPSGSSRRGFGGRGVAMSSTSSASGALPSSLLDIRSCSTEWLTASTSVVPVVPLSVGKMRLLCN